MMMMMMMMMVMMMMRMIALQTENSKVSSVMISSGSDVSLLSVDSYKPRERPGIVIENDFVEGRLNQPQSRHENHEDVGKGHIQLVRGVA